MVLLGTYVAGIVVLCLWLPAMISLGAAALALFILECAAAVCAAAAPMPASFKCLWLTAILCLPAAGAAAYFLTRCRLRPCERTLHCNSPTGCHAGYIADGEQFFSLLNAELEGAQRSIYLEFYIIARGEIFNAIYARLMAALGRGAEVKIITDALGSALRLPKKQFAKLKKRGAQIKIFNRLVPPPLSRLNFRDHRKIAVIDGRVAFTGGINIADEYAHITAPHEYWKDCGLRLEGGGATYLNELFLSMWRGCRSASLPPRGDGEDALEPVFDGPPAQCGRASARIVRALCTAKERVWAFTPYLCPDERVFAALCDCAARGVDVKIIVPAVPDKKPVYALTLDCAERLARAGVEVYAYTPGFMHAKAIIFDGGVLLGSYNLDSRSLWLNYECGAVIEGAVAEDVARDFEACLALCRKAEGKRLGVATLLSPLA